MGAHSGDTGTQGRAGVDVRVMYDGTCEFSTLPRDYPKRLEALGIRCKVFAPVTPFVSTHYNYRDHRKILVIDGRVGFTGGVNLADEYINHVERNTAAGRTPPSCWRARACAP